MALAGQSRKGQHLHSSSKRSPRAEWNLFMICVSADSFGNSWQPVLFWDWRPWQWLLDNRMITLKHLLPNSWSRPILDNLQPNQNSHFNTLDKRNRFVYFPNFFFFGIEQKNVIKTFCVHIRAEARGKMWKGDLHACSPWSQLSSRNWLKSGQTAVGHSLDTHRRARAQLI